MLMGGVSASQFWKVVLNLVNTLLLSISWGFLISCIFRLSVVTISTSLAWLILIGGGLPLLSVFLWEEMRLRELSTFVFILSPTHSHVFALTTGGGGGPKEHYWLCLGIQHAIIWINLRLAIFAL